jgi:DNA-binding IclR family transcriptional regulator
VRSLKILDMLIEADADPVVRERGITVQAISAEIEVHKTTALRLLKTLVEAGYAAPSVDGGHGYVLGPALRRGLELPGGIERFKEAARPFLEELVEQTGECAHAAVADGGRVLVIDDVETDKPLRVVPGSGRHVALHCTSAGKVLLAYGLAEVPAALPQRTARTITNPDALRAHLADIRVRGYAFDDEENAPYTRCISAPVFDQAGNAVGCVGIDAPSVRLTFERLPEAARHVMDAAASVSAALGYQEKGSHAAPSGASGKEA